MFVCVHEPFTGRSPARDEPGVAGAGFNVIQVLPPASVPPPNIVGTETSFLCHKVPISAVSGVAYLGKQTRNMRAKRSVHISLLSEWKFGS